VVLPRRMIIGLGRAMDVLSNTTSHLKLCPATDVLPSYDDCFESQFSILIWHSLLHILHRQLTLWASIFQ